MLTWATGDTQPTRIPDQLHRVLVYLHQTDGINVGQNPTVETTGTDLPKDRKKKNQTEMLKGTAWVSHYCFLGILESFLPFHLTGKFTQKVRFYPVFVHATPNDEFSSPCHPSRED